MNEAALFYGTPVTTTLTRVHQCARFWRVSTSDCSKGWIVVWRSVRAAPEPVLVSLSTIQRVDPLPAHLPPMPPWADSPYKPMEVDRSWVAERQASYNNLQAILERSPWSSFHRG